MTLSDPTASQIKPSWVATFKVYLEPPTLRMLLLGFSAGLPLLLVLGTLSFWLREAGIDRTTIGYLSWVGLAYAFKWAWAPLVDRMPIPVLTRWMGRRRSWLIVAQVAVMAGLVAMSFNDPQVALQPVVWGALAVALALPHKTLRWMPSASNRPTPTAKPRWRRPTRRAIDWP